MKKATLFISMLALLFSCRKKENIVEPLPNTPVSRFELKLNNVGDDGSLLFNQVNYLSAAGYSYSVTKLVYYLSRISLVRTDNSTFTLKDYHYADASVASNGQLNFTNIPEGDYKGISFNIGLDSVQNISNSLPATEENLNMQWPDPMGGGYHFLMLEGYFKDSSGTNGYAIHLGTNRSLIKIMLLKNFHFEKNSHIVCDLKMNVNEWLRSPNTFDFVKDGNYTMGNDPLMKKVAENGYNVFSFSP